MQVYDNDYEWTDQGNVPAALNAWIAEVAPGAKDEFLPSIFLWSSSEFNGFNARNWRVLSDGNVNCYFNNKDDDLHVRPVLAF